MNADVWIASGLALLTAAMAYLGVHMAVHLPKSDRAKRLYKAGFGTLAVGSVLLIVCQAKRSADGNERAGHAQERVEALLAEIKRQSERPIEAIVRLSASPGVPPTSAVPTPVLKSYKDEAMKLQAENTQLRNELDTIRQQANADQQRRHQLMDEIADFIIEGRALEQRAEDRSKFTQPPVNEATEWAKRTEAFLKTHLGESHVVRFRSGASLPSREPGLGWEEIGLSTRLAVAVRSRVSHLEQFNRELAR